MIHKQQQYTERRRMLLLAPLMVAGNGFLFLCMLGLCVVGLRGVATLGSISASRDADQQIVRDYLASTVPECRYRIREWLPVASVEGDLAAAAGSLAGATPEKGSAQRVQLVFYGPNGARQLDTIYWIQNGKVTRRVQVDVTPVPAGLHRPWFPEFWPLDPMRRG